MENPQENQVTSNIRENGNRVLKLIYNKDPDKGLLITAKGFANFRTFARPDGKKINWAGVTCYVPYSQEPLRGLQSYFYPSSTPEHFLFYNERPNLMLLLAEKLSEGVTFNFGCFPIASEELTDYIQKLNEEIKIAYHLYIKPRSVEVNFTSSIVETELLQ